jgi:histone acetyltransferase (RNA polymerase elongator complex component)
VFCDQNLITQQDQAPTPEEAAALIASHLRTLPSGGDVEAAFFGGNFTALPFSRQLQYVQAVQPFIAAGSVQGIRFSTRPDCIFPEQLIRLREMGVRVIELGVQSFDDEVLRQTERGYSGTMAIQACQTVKSLDFQLGVQLMPGLPGDETERCLASARVARDLQPDMVRIYPTVVLKGTELAVRWRNGTYKALELSAAVALVQEMFLLLAARGIKIIRMGLQAGEELNTAGQVLGGPYHPAFGELVEQSVFLRQALLLAESTPSPPGPAACFFIHPRDLSKFIGHKRQNMRVLADRLQRRVQVAPYESGEERGGIGLNYADTTRPAAWMSRRELLRACSIE